MSQKSTILITILLCISFLLLMLFDFQSDSKTDKEEIRAGKNSKQENEAGYDSPVDWMKYEFEMLKDPVTGKIPEGARQKELASAKSIPTKEQVTDNPENLNTYTSLGPVNIGGRTRALAIHKTNNQLLLAGGVSSGIFKSTDGGNTWVNKTPDNEIHNVTCIAQEGNTSKWFYGTGELLSNSASSVYRDKVGLYHGQGIYRSTNDGDNWIKLPQTSSVLEKFDSAFDYVNRIIVNPVNGDIYAACFRTIIRSKDNGDHWQRVLGVFEQTDTAGDNGYTDIVCTTTGRLYASFSGTSKRRFGGTGPDNGDPLEGVWTSATGDSGVGATKWTKIAGKINGTITPAGWKNHDEQPDYRYGRIVMALAPSNQNILYALYYNGNTVDCIIGSSIKPESDLFKFNKANDTWTNRSDSLPIDMNHDSCKEGNHPFAVQKGYDLCIAVKPDNENYIFVGGTSLYRSPDGFAQQTTSKRIGGYAFLAKFDAYPGHHPDMHYIAFDPSDSKKMFTADDGGVHKTNDVTAADVEWTSLNKAEYVTCQYYHVALSPEKGSKRSIGGTQDNGTTETMGTTTHNEIYGGDGVAVGISSENKYYYMGLPGKTNNVTQNTENGGLYRYNLTNFNITNIRPEITSSGIFVTYFLLDPDNTEVLYYVNNKELYRTKNASTVTSATWEKMSLGGVGMEGKIFSLAVTRGIYTKESKLYIGTDKGKIFLIKNHRDVNKNSPSILNITGNINIPNSTVIGIAVDPADDKKVLAVISNYNVKSIWYTDNAVKTPAPVWTDVEGNLADQSVRSCVIINRKDNPTEYYVGTSVGLYSTTNLNSTTTWAKEGSDKIKLSVVSSLKLRLSDNGFLVGTHGNGMFYSEIPDPIKVGKISAVKEGHYLASANSMIGDTFNVYLRTVYSPYNIVDSSKGYIDDTGFGTFGFSNSLDSIYYYLQLKNRNTIETWSAAGGAQFSDSQLYYDFTTSSSQAFGNNEIQVDNSPVTFAVYSGDVNQDGIIDFFDLSALDNDSYNFVSGYVVTDLNGDEVVDVIDLSIADNNAYNFVGSIIP